MDMAEWNNIHLSDVLVDKGYIRGPFGSALKRGDMKDSGIPVYEQQHAIYNSRYFRYYIDEQKFNEMKRFQVNTDDLIISCSGTVGKVSIIRNDDPKGIISQALLLLRVDKNKILPLYLKYFFTSRDGYNAIVSRSSGSVQINIAKRNIIEQIPLMLPKIETQRKIVEILSSIDEKIEENQKINENLEHQSLALFSNYYEQSDTEIGFTDLIQVLGGGTPKTSESTYWNGNIPFFTPKDVGFPYTLATEKTITEDGLLHCNSRLYPVNTVFVTARGTVGKVGIAGVPMAMNQSCYALIGKGIHQLLVYFYTLKAIDRLKHKASGAVFDAIITKDFETEQVFKLSPNNTDTFIRIVEPMYQSILNNSIEKQRLIALRDSLLPKLMSGEIDVSKLDI